ncbi:MAG TPA: DUF4270 family protein [Cytophagaceae bacterium]|jgi:hypothetical protein|nr:DUF4270 family protein [Cytophagaceae bacterium]
MSLLIKRIVFLKTGLLVVVILFFLGCRKEKNYIGYGDANHIPNNTFFTDTITIKSEVVLIGDSINTTNISNGSSGSDTAAFTLAGAYADPYLGNISAEAYTQILLKNEFIELPAATADSAYLYLNYSYCYGDTSQPQTLNIYRLTNAIQSYTNYYSNSAGISYNPIPIASVTFYASADSNSTIVVPIKGPYLQEILNGSKNNTDFMEQFPGLAIIPASNSQGAILRIDGSYGGSAFRIFYTQYSQSGIYYLSLGKAARRFYRVVSDRSATDIASLKNKYDSVNTNTFTMHPNTGYIQACIGIRTKLSFPYLLNFRTAFNNMNIAVMSSQLVLTASPTSDTSKFKVSSGLYLMQTTPDSIRRTPASGIYYVQPDGANQILYNSYTVAYPSNGVYTFSVRSYIQAVLLGQLPNYPIIVSPYNLGVEVNRLVFRDNQSPISPLKLNLYFTTTK